MNPDGAKKAWPVRMFVSYSHENAAWCKRLLPVLRVKANVDTLQPWHDTELRGGDRWDKEIRAELERMDIFLCLVSFHFLASGYIQTVELPIAKARHKKGEIEVVPVVLYPMDLQHDCEFLYQLNPLPEWVKCLGWSEATGFEPRKVRRGNVWGRRGLLLGRAGDRLRSTGGVLHSCAAVERFAALTCK